MTDLGRTGADPTSPEEDLGDPIDDPDGDDQNVKVTLPPDQDEGLEHAGGVGPARACKAALAEATQRAPSRNTASDRIMGDAAHCPGTSDHCSGNAFDLTHDPGRGCDAHALIEGLRQRRDPRVKYLISKRRIWNPSISMDWRPYTRPNPHETHAHVSIHGRARDDTSPWWGGGGDGGGGGGKTRCPVPHHPQLKQGAKGEIVRHLQDLLSRSGHAAAVDGDFGPGTLRAVRSFQQAKGLGVDGIVGPRTWGGVHEVVNEHI